MPDTAIVRSVEETRMDAEIRDALARQDRVLERIDSKLDTIRETSTDLAVKLAKVEEKATAAHRRIDEGVSDSGVGWKAWAAIIGAALTSIGTSVAAYFKAQGK